MSDPTQLKMNAHPERTKTTSSNLDMTAPTTLSFTSGPGISPLLSKQQAVAERKKREKSWEMEPETGPNEFSAARDCGHLEARQMPPLH